MRFPLLEMPDNPADWPNWLEQQLVGLELRELVVDLQALSGADGSTTASGPTLEEALAGKLDEALARGLSGAGPDAVRALLNHPHLLLELQERAFSNGSDYWAQLPLSAEHLQRVEKDWEQLVVKVDDDAPVSLLMKQTPREERETGRRALLRQLLAVAAMIAIVAGFWYLRSPREAPQIAGWGFDKPGLLQQDLPSAEYLEALAGAAGMWFNTRPDTVADLSQRLQEFRHGCNSLIAAAHPQLTDEDRAWLIERCRVWKGKIEAHLTDLDAGAKPALVIRDEADATVNTLIDALRQRARATARLPGSARSTTV